MGGRKDGMQLRQDGALFDGNGGADELAARKLVAGGGALAAWREFDQFWLRYPRKVSKETSRRAWAKLTPAERSAAVASLNLHVAQWTASGTEKQFIPHPSTWLNAKRWEDELPSVPWRARWEPLLICWDGWKPWCDACIRRSKVNDTLVLDVGGDDWDGFSEHECEGTLVRLHIAQDFDPTFGQGPYWSAGTGMPLTRVKAFAVACQRGVRDALAVRERWGCDLVIPR